MYRLFLHLIQTGFADLRKPVIIIRLRDISCVWHHSSTDIPLGRDWQSRIWSAHSISRYWRATVVVSISIVFSSIAVPKVKTKLFRRIILLLRLLLHKNGGMTMYGLWSGYKVSISAITDVGRLLTSSSISSAAILNTSFLYHWNLLFLHFLFSILSQGKL